MEKYVLVAIASPLDGKSEEFNRCYDDVHIPDLLAIPGIVSAQRYGISEASPMPCPSEYLALYQVETEDPAALMAEMRRRSQSGESRPMQGLDREKTQLWLFKQM